MSNNESAPGALQPLQLTRDDGLGHLSASQLKTADECPRKWYWQKIIGVRVPETGAMTLGKAIHSELEGWARGSDAPLSPLAAAGLVHLPPRSEALLAESPLEQPSLTLRGIPFLGYIDLAAPPGAWRDVPAIVDHKTTSDFRWAKTPDALSTDPQAVAYARWAAMRYYGAGLAEGAIDAHPATDTGDRTVDVRFVYYRTRGAIATKPVDVTFKVRDLAPQWERFGKTVDAMKRYAEVPETEARAVPANLSACDMFGGCPHRARCGAIARPTARPGTGISLSAALGLSPAPAAPVVSVSNLVRKDDEGMAKGKLSAVVPAVERREGFTLYVDAMPVTGEPAADLAPVLAEVAAGVANAANAPDVLCIEFGKWKGPFRAELIARELSGAWVVRSTGELGAVAAEALRPYAATVVQGLR